MEKFVTKVMSLSVTLLAVTFVIFAIPLYLLDSLVIGGYMPFISHDDRNQGQAPMFTGRLVESLTEDVQRAEQRADMASEQLTQTQKIAEAIGSEIASTLGWSKNGPCSQICSAIAYKHMRNMREL